MKLIHVIILLLFITSKAFGTTQIWGPSEVQGGDRYVEYVVSKSDMQYILNKDYTVSVTNGVASSNRFTISRDAGNTIGSTSIYVKWNNVEGEGSLTVHAVGSSTSYDATLKVTISPCKNTSYVGMQITSSRNYSNCRNMVFTNVSITNNATVNITAEEKITITPNFLAQQGTTVIIKATGGGILRSSSINNDEDEKEGMESIFAESSITSIRDIPGVSQTTLINIYSFTGLKVYSSTTDFDIKSANLSPGIYIIESINNKGETKREKVLIDR